MAVDLSISESIMNAYSRGLQDARLREKDKADKLQQEVDNKAKADQAAEQKRQFDESVKRQDNEFKAQQGLRQSQFKMAQILALPEFQKLAESSGTIPGATKHPFITPSGETDPNKNDFQLPDEIGGYHVEALTPEAAATRDKNAFMQGPEYAKLQETERAKAELADAERKSKEEQERLNRESRERVGAMREKGQIEAARIRGTSDKTIQQAIGLKNDFTRNPIVTRFSIVKGQHDYAQDIGKSGIDDTALVYSLIKMLDPNRVSDSEVNLARDYGQSMAEKFEFNVKRLSSHDGRFLSDNARANMLATINDKFKAEEGIYKNFRNESAKQFKNINQEPEHWLPELNQSVDEPVKPGKVVKFSDLPKGGK